MPGYWPNAIPELLAMFQSTDFQGLTPDRRVWILLEVLTVIPEEVCFLLDNNLPLIPVIYTNIITWKDLIFICL